MEYVFYSSSSFILSLSNLIHILSHLYRIWFQARNMEVMTKLDETELAVRFHSAHSFFYSVRILFRSIPIWYSWTDFHFRSLLFYEWMTSNSLSESCRMILHFIFNYYISVCLMCLFVCCMCVCVCIIRIITNFSHH